MKFAVTSKEKQFLHKLGFVELASCLKESQYKELREALERAPLRDPHTSTETLNKLALKKDFTHLFGELYNKKRIRLLTTAINPNIHALTDLCFQGIIGGFIFTVTEELPPEHLEFTLDTEKQAITPTTSLPTSLLVVSADTPLLPPPEGALSFVVVYGEEDAVYIKNDSDPEKMKLSKQGLAFNDAVKDPLHPLIHTR